MPKQTGLTVDEITTILNSTHLYSENFPPLPSSNPPKSRQQSLPTNSPPLTQKAMEEEAFVPDYSPNSTPSPIPANNSHNEITTVEINRPPIRAPSPSIETTALKSLPASAGSSSLNRNRPLPLLSLSTTDHVVKRRYVPFLLLVILVNQNKIIPFPFYHVFAFLTTAKSRNCLWRTVSLPLVNLLALRN